jgi:competence protein ComEA
MKTFESMVLAALLAISGAAFAAEKPEQILPTEVNINTADAATLAAMLDGVGASRAQAIVEYRKANGPFESVDELVEVKGIGDSVVEQNRARIRVK